jgi:rRNA processing protein Gar1
MFGRNDAPLDVVKLKKRSHTLKRKKEEEEAKKKKKQKKKSRKNQKNKTASGYRMMLRKLLCFQVCFQT